MTERLLIVVCMCLASPALAGVPKLKVYVSADMEGIGGISTWEKQASPKSADYGQFRKLMTQEVNAAIAGAFDAGATEVLVGDSHWDGQNLDLELLDKRARVVQSWPRPLVMMEGIDGTFDAVLLVGYHAAEGTPGALLAHTVMGGRIFEIRLNGVPVPEAGISAATAGEFGVPVVLVSGDQAIAEQARKLLGPVETAVVKTAGGFLSGTMMHPEESRRLVRDGARRGVERRRELKPYKLARPVKLEITFKNIALAEVASYLQGVERPRGNVVVYTARDMLDASRFLSVLMYLDVKLLP
jgi:D-amino peptidase